MRAVCFKGFAVVNINDLSLVIGVLLTVFSIPSLLNAWTEDRLPRFGGIICLTGMVLIGVAAARNPSGYALGDIPAAFTRVIRALLS